MTRTLKIQLSLMFLCASWHPGKAKVSLALPLSPACQGAPAEEGRCAASWYYPNLTTLTPQVLTGPAALLSAPGSPEQPLPARL